MWPDRTLKYVYVRSKLYISIRFCIVAVTMRFKTALQTVPQYQYLNYKMTRHM